MARRAPEETVDRAYALRAQDEPLCLSVARDGFEAFVVELPPFGATTIGRDAQADFAISSPSLSRLHVSLEVQGDGVQLRDLGSRNGTIVDGKRLDDAPKHVPPGAEVVAGDVRFALLRRSSLPSAARPFLLPGPFEAALAAEEAGFVAAIELPQPVNQGSGALEVLAQVSAECSLGLRSDVVVLLRSPDESLVDWTLRALAQKGFPASRHAVRATRGGDGAPLPAVLRELSEISVEAYASRPAEDVPPAFRYPSLRRLHDDLRRIAPRPISVLITGETGTGKEVVAREIHRLSGRKGPLVAVNMAALPENLIESELFGHERGAFSGALTAKAGLIETADKGTLFLDEIGELSLPLQAKLLRVLEDQSVRRVGATTERKVDLRVVAATHQNLEALEKEKRFRQDLLFRLNGASIAIPPLRQRRGEVAGLARQLLAELASPTPPTLDPSAAVAMDAYAWPGNVRELKHVLERALAFADAGVIMREHLPASFATETVPPPADRASGDVRSTVKDFERDRIVEALRAAGGNRTRAAEMLGLPRRTLVYKLSKMKLGDE